MTENQSRYFQLTNIPLGDRYDNGVQRGNLLGFYALKDCFSVVPGSTLYIYGAPFSGKTQFKYEILMQLTELYGWKHLVFDPETGSKEDVAQMLIEMYVRADLTGDYGNQMRRNMMEAARVKLEDHFYIFDPDDTDVTLKDIFDKADQIERENNIEINTVSIDPWDYLKHEYGEFDATGRDDRYLMEALKYVYRNARKNGRYNILINHVQNLQKRKDPNTGIWYFPQPTAHDLAFGQEWYRKAMAMVGVWRPEQGITDREGREFEWNESVVTISKAKPKGVADPANKEWKHSLFYDPKFHRYYEKQGTQRRFAQKVQGHHEVARNEAEPF